MREKAPAYQRYPKQIMGDDKVLLMDWDAYGMHNWLLDTSWQQEPKGTIPNDQDVLRRWLRLPRNVVACGRPDAWCRCNDCIWRRVWPQISTAWPLQESGRLGNSGMIRCAEKQANYSSGNRGKEKYANRTQIGTQIVPDLSRKNTEDEDVFKRSIQFSEERKTLNYEFGVEEFFADEWVEKFRVSWPKPGGADVLQPAFDAIEREARKGLSRQNAAANIHRELQRCAALVAMWPRHEQNKIPRLSVVLNECRYEWDDPLWEKADARSKPRESAIDRYRQLQTSRQPCDGDSAS